MANFTDAIKMVLDVISKLDFKSVLCTRIKDNPWGSLIYQYFNTRKIYEKSPFRFSILGNDPLENFLTKDEKEHYKVIYPGDPLVFLDESTFKTDLIVVENVLEYMDKQRAIKMISTVLQKSKYSLFFIRINKPLSTNQKQGIYANILSTWRKEEFLPESNILNFSINDGKEEVGVFFFENNKTANEEE